MYLLLLCLQIREDTKNGVYVENITEEYVASMDDVTQLFLRVCML
jgi:kinesin family protein 15